MASTAYLEHVGWNRQCGPSKGEIRRRYISIKRTNAPDVSRDSTFMRSPLRPELIASATAYPEGWSKLRFDIPEAQLFRACPRNDQHVSGRLQFAPMQTKKLSYQSLHPIPSHRVADPAAHRHAEPTIALQGRWCLDHHEMSAPAPAISRLQFKELRSLANPPVPRKRPVRVSRARVWAVS